MKHSTFSVLAEVANRPPRRIISAKIVHNVSDIDTTSPLPTQRRIARIGRIVAVNVTLPFYAGSQSGDRPERPRYFEKISERR